MSSPDLLVLKASSWFTVESEYDNDLRIYVGGLTRDSKTVMVCLTGFCPSVYLELPVGIRWDVSRASILFEYLRRVMAREGPLKFELSKKRKIYGLTETMVLKLTFSTHRATRKLANRCMRAMTIDPLGTFPANSFSVHEHVIDPILKMTALRSIQLAGWMSVVPTVSMVSGDTGAIDAGDTVERFSSAEFECTARWDTLNPVAIDESILVYPKYASFDLECYSSNHNSKLPNAEEDENVVICIAVIIGRLYSKPSRRVLLTLGWPADIPDAEVLRFDPDDEGERSLLLAFRDLILEEDPDFFLGYNIMKFDWGYLLTRANKLGILHEFQMLSRLTGTRAEIKEVKWASSAYGIQSFQFPDVVGRVNVDLFCEIERNYRLPNYTLNTVSEYFLKESKVDLSPRQLFLLYQVTRDLGPLLHSSIPLTRRKFLEIQEKVSTILRTREVKGEVREIKRRILEATTVRELRTAIDSAIHLIGVYCLQDTILPIRLCEKLNVWPTMVEMSNCTNVPMSYLHTRGQQIKVLAQIYREALRDNILVQTVPRPKEGEEDDTKYQGAIVIEAHPGYYNLVVTFDFASLYPTTMIANNICYTTLVGPDDPIPDERCHVVEWEEHVGCGKDRGCPKDPNPTKKVKKADVRCSHFRFRFRRVEVTPDGKKIGEGLMPRLERTLLEERKKVKKEMNRLNARLLMNSGKATESDISAFSRMGWEILSPKSLSDEDLKVTEVTANVYDARQLALKVSANSGYGFLGAKKGFLPFIPGAASVTAMGRKYITMAIDNILTGYSDAGAKLVYGDTDSCMITFPSTGDYSRIFDLANEISKEVTHFLRCYMIGIDPDTKFGRGKVRLSDLRKTDLEKLTPSERIRWWEYEGMPLELAFENCYSKFLLLTKKRYMAESVNRKGEPLKTTKKGVVLARRDNSLYLRTTYRMVADAIFAGKDRSEVEGVLLDRISALFTRSIPDTELIIYVGIRNVMSYAKRLRGSDPPSETNPYLDAFGKPIDTDDLSGPLDPRLQYRNLPQALLALKILRRGEDIPPNTRLEFLYLENPEAVHQGQKAEDFTYYVENRERFHLRPDYFHYIEKQLTKPLTELLSVKFPPVMVSSEKMEEAFDRCTRSLTNEYLRHSLEKIRGMSKKVNAVLASAKSNLSGNPSTKFSYRHHAELIEVCRRLKASSILDAIRKKAGLRKISEPRKKKGEETRQKDSHLLREILTARRNFRNVIDELKGQHSLYFGR